MPGLTVDRYGDILVAQVLSMGMERVQDQVFQALCEVLKELGEPLRGIYLRNDVAIRELEGLEQSKGWYPLPGSAVAGVNAGRNCGKRCALPGGCGERTENRILSGSEV